MPLRRHGGGLDLALVDDPAPDAAVRAGCPLLIVVVAVRVGADELAFEQGCQPGAEMHGGDIGARWRLVYLGIIHRILWLNDVVHTKCAFQPEFGGLAWLA